MKWPTRKEKNIANIYNWICH